MILEVSSFQSARRGLVHRGLAQCVDFVLPPLCIGCGTIVDSTGGLCASCWNKIDFIGPPYCTACGHPFEFDLGDYDAGAEILCGVCARSRPVYVRARSVFRYAADSRQLVLAYKHGDRIEATPAFAAWLARSGAELVDAADLIVPVPLHRRRLFARRYNQASLLACALAKRAGRLCVLDALVRQRATPPQGRLGVAARQRNVRGAFQVRAGREAGIVGRRVLLIDDVFTSGATVGECARVLLAGGAAAVDVLTLARVVRASA